MEASGIDGGARGARHRASLIGAHYYNEDLGVAFQESTDELSWSYLNYGDYDLNGEVNLADYIPIARYYKQVVTGDAARTWIDGDGNGEINLADATRIADNFGSKITVYRVLWTDRYDMADAEEGFKEVTRLSVADRAPGYPPRFVVKLPSPVKNYVKVEALPLPAWPAPPTEQTIFTDPSLPDPSNPPLRDYTDPNTGEHYQILDGVVIVGFKVQLSDPRVQAFIDAEQLKLMNVWDFWPQVAAIEVYLPAGTTVENAVMSWPGKYPAIIDAVEPDYAVDSDLC